MPSQQVLQERINEIEAIIKLLKQYKVIGIASLKKVRASQLQELKKKLADKVYMRVMKNTSIKIALEKYKEKTELKKLEEHMEGSNIFLFTDLNPFKLVLLLERGKVETTARSGDIAAFDVIVPAGSTGQPPGPIIAHLNAVGLPTRIESGSVWVSKDTLVVKKGEVISERLASVLSKLGIKPVETGLKMNVVYDEGMIIAQNQLEIDIDSTMKSLKECYAKAFALSVNTSYPTSENIVMILQVAHQKACSLSINAVAPTKETIVDLIRKAQSEMLYLNNFVQKGKVK